MHQTRPGRLYLSDVLVSYFADLLDVCCALRHGLERVAEEDQLVLLRLGDLDVDAGLHYDAAHNLLADEVPERSLRISKPFPPRAIPATRLAAPKEPYRISTS